NDTPRWIIDSYNYLATIDEWAKRFQNDTATCEKVWSKLLGGSPSVFLDTLVELVWVLYFMDQGFPVSFEAKFDPLNPDSKDADLLVTMEGKKHWLDVASIGHQQAELPARVAPIVAMWGRPSREQTAAALAKRAERKYIEKF